MKLSTARFYALWLQTAEMYGYYCGNTLSLNGKKEGVQPHGCFHIPRKKKKQTNWTKKPITLLGPPQYCGHLKGSSITAKICDALALRRITQPGIAQSYFTWISSFRNKSCKHPLINWNTGFRENLKYLFWSCRYLGHNEGWSLIF